MHIQQNTVIGDFDSPNAGYFVIAPLSRRTIEKIHAVQESLQRAFPVSSLWLPKNEQLHITFLHIIDPNWTVPPIYKNVDEAYHTMDASVKDTLSKIIPQSFDIPLKSRGLYFTPAAMYIDWDDLSSTYTSLRNRFVDEFTLPEGVRRPPKIVHTTIARFYKEVPLHIVQKSIETMQLGTIIEHSTCLQLVHEHKQYLQKHTVLAEYP